MKCLIHIKLAALFSSAMLLFSCGTQPATPGHKHSFATTWSTDSTYHWHDCTGCDEVSDKSAHTFGQWTTTVEATIVSAGSKERECSVCHYKETETIDPVNFPTDFVIPFRDLESRVYLPYSSSEIFIGSTYFLSPVIINSSIENVKYQVSDSTIISVNNSIVTGLKAGGAYLRAYNDIDNDNSLDDNEPFALMSFSVITPDPNVNFTADKENISMKVGEQTTVTPSITGMSVSGFDYGYYSENNEICTFSKGKLVAHKAGITNIFITCKGYKHVIPVTVTDYSDDAGVHASGIDVQDKDIVLSKGETHQIQYSLIPNNAVDTIASYRSNNESVASVDENGVVTAVSQGSVLITLTSSNNKVARVLVNVTSEAASYNDYYDGYYGNLTWENGVDLKQKLHNIIKNNKSSLKYDSPNWESNQKADEYFYDSSKVELVYSDSQLGKDEHGTSGEVWQREHAFAASLMTGYSTGAAVKNLGRATDFHNLFAAKGSVNGSRGNKNFGYANPSSAEYETKEICGYTKNVFEPTNDDKGRLARAIFYMGVMYNENEVGTVKESWKFSGEDIKTHSGQSTTLTLGVTEQDLQITEDVIDYNKISLDKFMLPTEVKDAYIIAYYRYVALQNNPSLVSGSDEHRAKAYELYSANAMPFAIGGLSSLLEWNSYAVDLYEVQHNNSVYSYTCSAGAGKQGNRNPFVDYPQLVDYVYGDLQDQPGSISNLKPSYYALSMDVDGIHHYQIDSSKEYKVNVGETIKYEDMGIKAIKNDLTIGTVDYSKFSCADATYVFEESDIATGKDIVINTDKNSISVHVSVIGEDQPKEEIALEDCSYNYVAATKPQDAFVKRNDSNIYDAELNGKQWIMTTEKAVTLSSSNGVKIGAASAGAGTITLETKDSISDINAVIFRLYCPKNSPYSYEIYIGESKVIEGSLTKDSATLFDYGVFFKEGEEKAGKVKLVVKGLSSYISLKGIGINSVTK